MNTIHTLLRLSLLALALGGCAGRTASVAKSEAIVVAPSSSAVSSEGCNPMTVMAANPRLYQAMIDGWVPPTAYAEPWLLDCAIAMNLDPSGALVLKAVQTRLDALNLFSGEINGKQSEPLKAAVSVFQRRTGLRQTGLVNAATAIALAQK